MSWELSVRTSGYTSSPVTVVVTTSVENVSISIGSAITSLDVCAETARLRVSTALRAAAFRFFVAAALFPAARRCRVVAAFLAAAFRRFVAAAFTPARRRRRVRAALVAAAFGLPGVRAIRVSVGSLQPNLDEKLTQSRRPMLAGVTIPSRRCELFRCPPVNSGRLLSRDGESRRLWHAIPIGGVLPPQSNVMGLAGYEPYWLCLT